MTYPELVQRKLPIMTYLLTGGQPPIPGPCHWGQDVGIITACHQITDHYQTIPGHIPTSTIIICH